MLVGLKGGTVLLAILKSNPTATMARTNLCQKLNGTLEFDVKPEDVKTAQRGP